MKRIVFNFNPSSPSHHSQVTPQSGEQTEVIYFHPNVVFVHKSEFLGVLYTWGQTCNCFQASIDPFLHALARESPQEFWEKSWLSPRARGEGGRVRGRVGRCFGRGAPHLQGGAHAQGQWEAPHLQGAEVPLKHQQTQFSSNAWPTVAPVLTLGHNIIVCQGTWESIFTQGRQERERSEKF